MTGTPVFVWRTTGETSSQGPHCRHCENYIAGVSQTSMGLPKEEHREAFRAVAQKYIGDPYWDEFESTGSGGRFAWQAYELICKRCGWWASGVTNFNGEKFERIIEAGLRDFDINDGNLAIQEVVSHVHKHADDIFSLSPRKFEELVGDVYSNIGWKVELTKQSRDGGVDLVCLKHSSGESCIVECKRYAKSRKVGIAAIDRLVGAAFRTNTRSAHLVTSSSFSKPAKEAKGQATEHGLDVEFIDGYELLKLVDTFADPTLTLSDLEQIYSSR